MRQTAISAQTIRKELKSFTPESAIVEYIKNGIDARAKNIYITFSTSTLGYIADFCIQDDGEGINFFNLNEVFLYFRDSHKKHNKNSSEFSGKNGHGRYTFFHFCDQIEWDTSFEKDGKIYQYTIKSDISNISLYDVIDKLDDLMEIPSGSTGTTVSFYNLHENISEDFLKNTLVEEILKQLAWKIKLNNINIFINDRIIDINSIIDKEKVEHKKIDGVDFHVTLVKWKERMKNEDSKFYFLNSDQKEVFKVFTSFNRGGDNFFHSAYVISEYFDDFVYNGTEHTTNMSIFGESKKIKNQHDGVFKALSSELYKMVAIFRRPFIVKQAKEFIKNKIDRNNTIIKTSSELGRISLDFVKDTFQEIYLIEPKFLNSLTSEQVGILANLFNVCFQEGNDNLLKIIDASLKLTQEEREDFVNMIEAYSLDSMIKIQKIIDNRLKVLDVLSQLTSDKDLGANEVNHIQGIVENNYWLFGDEYYLVGAAELKITEALRRYRNLVYNEDNKKGDIEMSSDQRNKELDIFMCKIMSSLSQGEIRVGNIIVELKHPSITLGRKQADQIEDYMNAIRKDPLFNGDTSYWCYYLVGNEYDDVIEGRLATSQNNGKDSIYKSNDGKVMIFCKKWSDIIQEHQVRLSFMLEGMKKKTDFIKLKNADEGLEISISENALNIDDTTRSRLPVEVIKN